MARVLLGVTGGIAAYKLAEFNERALKEGAAPLPEIGKLWNKL